LQNAKTTNQQVGVRVTNINKKMVEVEAAKVVLAQERDSVIAQLDMLRVAHQAQVDVIVQKSLKESEAAKNDLETKDKTIDTNKEQLQKLRVLGRNLKSKNDVMLTEVAKLKEDQAKVEEELKVANLAVEAAQAATAAINLNQLNTPIPCSSDQSSADDTKLAEAESLLEQSIAQIAELEAKVEELTKVKVELEAAKVKLDDQTKKRERAKQILVKAKSQMTSVTKEKDDLAKQVEELKSIKGLGGPTPANVKIFETAKKSLEAALETEKAEKEAMCEAHKAEKDKLIKQVAALETEKAEKEAKSENQPVASASVTGMVKPVVSTAGSQSKKPHPQAHIQPTRHSAQGPPQTATIRPNPMRTSAAASMRSTVAPSMVASVSPSTAEIVPRAEAVVETSTVEETPNVAMVTPRQSSDEPMASSSTASVAPTQKRQRDDEAKPEGAKKARVTREEHLASTQVPQPAATSTTYEDDADVVILDSSSDEGEYSEVDDELTTEGEAEYEDIEEQQGQELHQDEDVVEDEEYHMIDDDDSQDNAVVVDAASSDDGDDDDDGDGEEDESLQVQSPGQSDELGGAVVPQMGEATSSGGGANMRPVAEATNSSQGSAQGSLGRPQQVKRILFILIRGPQIVNRGQVGILGHEGLKSLG
jgi:hypothetical protein